MNLKITEIRISACFFSRITENPDPVSHKYIQSKCHLQYISKLHSLRLLLFIKEGSLILSVPVVKKHPQEYRIRMQFGFRLP